MGVPIALVVGVFIGYLTGNQALGTKVGLRIAGVGGIAALAGGLGRWVCGAQFNQLSLVRTVRGDWGAVLGFALALLVIGCAGQKAARSSGKLVIGSPVEIAGPTLDGQTFDLASYRGKVVMVDFWATWCGPCVAELPNVKKVYEKHHDRGLEIVGVSFDYERDTLTKFVKTKAVPWPQIFFEGPDKQGWDNPIGRKYGIDGIPMTLVIDRDGNLADYDLRGTELEAAVGKLLGQEPKSAQVLSFGRQLLSWLFHAVLQTPLLIVLLGCLGGALVGALVEAGIRRAWGGPGKSVAGLQAAQSMPVS